MRQSIEMLLKPAFELREMILSEAEENPFLEVEDWGDGNQEKFLDTEGYSDISAEVYEENGAPESLKISDDKADMSDILANFDWQQVTESSSNSFGDVPLNKRNDDWSDFNFESVVSAKESFEQYLDFQICSLDASDSLKNIMIYMAYNLDKRGFLKESDKEIAGTINVDIAEVAKAREMLKSMEPKGSGCHNLVDYLRYLFTEVLKAELPEKFALPIQKLFHDENMLDLLIKKDFNGLCDNLHLLSDELKELFQFFRKGFAPYPSYGYEIIRVEYATPDLKVFLVNGETVIQIEDKMLPSVTLKTEIFSEKLKKAKTREERKFIREKYRNAEWLIKSISERNRTLYQVAASIFNFQKAFLELGENFLKPLALKDVSDDIDRHPATVSRLTNKKYAETPHGMYELKFFFVKQVNESHTTNKRLEQMIVDIIGKESKDAPLSDEDITNLLAREGVEVARRTVAKYRAKLSIPLARERKRNYQFFEEG